jgi:hypothetical protein
MLLPSNLSAQPAKKISALMVMASSLGKNPSVFLSNSDKIL